MNLWQQRKKTQRVCSLHGFSNCQLSLLATLQHSKISALFRTSLQQLKLAHITSQMHLQCTVMEIYLRLINRRRTICCTHGDHCIRMCWRHTQLNVSLTIVQRPDRLFRSHNLVPESPQTPCLRQPRWNLPLQSRVGVGRQLPVAQVRTTRAACAPA